MTISDEIGGIKLGKGAPESLRVGISGGGDK
jgi:hypothetical protein